MALDALIAAEAYDRPSRRTAASYRRYVSVPLVPPEARFNEAATERQIKRTAARIVVVSAFTSSQTSGSFALFAAMRPGQT
jgi:hypothetical protein